MILHPIAFSRPLRFRAIFWLFALGFTAAATSARSASAAVIDIPTSVDGEILDLKGDSVYNHLSTGGEAIGPSDFLIFVGPTVVGHGHARGIWEFNLAAIPKNAIINSLTFRAQTDIEAASGFITIDFGGYAGNGKIELADATATNTPIGSFGVQIGDPALANPVSISLDKTLLQSLLGKSNYFGLAAWRDAAASDSNAYAIEFDSLENLNKQYPVGTLRVDYSIPQVTGVPLPIGASAALLPLLALGVASRCKRLQPCATAPRSPPRSA